MRLICFIQELHIFHTGKAIWYISVLFEEFLLHKEINYSIKDTLKAFNGFKNKQKNVWSNVFWYVKVYIFWICIQYIEIRWDKTQMLKNSFGQNKR